MGTGGRENGPSVGVVVPTYNRRQLLAATLDSLAALEPPPDEVIVVSDGGTDGSDEVVRSQGLRLLRTCRQGAAAARNAGWRATGAQVVAFIDDDAVADPGWLRAMTAPFGDDAVGLVQGVTRPAGPVGPLDRTIEVVRESGIYESCNIAYRRAALEAVGGFDEAFGRTIRPRAGGRAGGGGSGFGEDTDLAWRVRRAGWRSAFAEDAIVRHAVFPGTLRDVLAEEWRKGNFPFLVREIPELRDRLPLGPWFLRRQSPWAQLALLAPLVAARRPLAGAALAAPYAGWLARNRAPSAVALQVARDAVASVALLVGSVRERRLVL